MLAKLQQTAPELYGGLMIVLAMAILGLSDNLFYYLEPYMGLGQFHASRSFGSILLLVPFAYFTGIYGSDKNPVKLVSMRGHQKTCKKLVDWIFKPSLQHDITFTTCTYHILTRILWAYVCIHLPPSLVPPLATAVATSIVLSLAIPL